jgi:hypothetical protein
VRIVLGDFGRNVSHFSMFDRDSKDSCENPKCFFDLLKRNEKEMNQNKRIILLVDYPLYNVKNIFFSKDQLPAFIDKVEA